jgi:hypothetical protein
MSQSTASGGRLSKVAMVSAGVVRTRAFRHEQVEEGGGKDQRWQTEQDV